MPAEDRTAGRGHRTEDRQDHQGLSGPQVRRDHLGLRVHRDLAGRQGRAPLGHPGHRVREEPQALPDHRPGHLVRQACQALAAAPAGGLEVETPEGQADVEEW